MKPPKPIVEICVQGVPSAIAAERGGADRVELCENLDVGGVTPGPGAIALACERLTIPVHVLIRPRGGDFTYDKTEMEIMRRDVVEAKRLGAAGVALGALTPSGDVDREFIADLVALARPLSLTFHKAFDEVRDPETALELLTTLGVDRVLTSGRAPSAIEGIDALRSWRTRAAGGLVILAGGRIRLEHIPPLLAAGISELHFGSAAGPPGACDEAAARRIVDTVANSA